MASEATKTATSDEENELAEMAARIAARAHSSCCSMIGNLLAELPEGIANATGWTILSTMVAVSIHRSRGTVTFDVFTEKLRGLLARTDILDSLDGEPDDDEHDAPTVAGFDPATGAITFAEKGDGCPCPDCTAARAGV